MKKLIEEITKLKKSSDENEDYYDAKYQRTGEPEYLLNSKEYANQSIAYQKIIDLIIGNHLKEEN